MLGEHSLNLLFWLPRMCGIYLPDVSYDYILTWGLSGWEGHLPWCRGLNWKWTGKRCLGFSALDFGWQFLCSETRNGQCVPYLPGHAVKYLRKGGIILLLELFLGEGWVLKVLFFLPITPSGSCSGLQKWAFAVAALERAAALSGKLQRCIWPRSQFCKARPGWWFPEYNSSQPQPGVGGTGRGPRPRRAWKRGSLELKLAVLHFPREQDEERQFLCWPSSMIHGEFKHSIDLLCNLAVLLIFSLGKFASHQRNVYLSFFKSIISNGWKFLCLSLWDKFCGYFWYLFFPKSHNT